MKLTVFRKLKLYLKIWYATFILSMSKATTFKIEVIVRFIRGVMLVAIQIIFIKAVIGNTGNFAGWTEDQMYLLSGIFNFVNYISWAFFSTNLWRMEEKILKGEFDALLLKPMPSMYSAAFPEFFIDDAISGISGVLLVGYYIVKNFWVLSPLNYLYGFIAIMCAFLVWFSLEIIFASFDFLAIKNGLREIKQSVTNMARFPMEIWSPNIRIVFYTAFPIAFVSIVPSGLISGMLDWKYLVLEILASITIFLFARFIWNTSLKKYASGGN